jgi:two-component system nitrogen regulation sensor histidine kinase NtrY
MKLRTKYILFVAILHLVALVLSYFIFSYNRIFFIISEVFIFFSIVIAWQLYHQLIQPLNLLMQGVEAIKDRDFNVKFLQTGKYELDILIEAYNQMMDELRTERIKQEQQHMFLEKLIYTSPTGILILDFDEHIHQVNPKALELLGMEEKEIIQKSLTEIDHPVLQQVKLLTSGQAKTFTVRNGITYKVQKSHFIDRGFPRQFVMIQELTVEILEAEKKTYGKVIRMMAHEVNNTIGPVNSILQSTLQSGTYNESVTHALHVAIERNDNLNYFMRNFADLVRIPPPEKKHFDLVPLLQKVCDLMQLKAGARNISFQFELEGTSFMVAADTHQLEQVLINVIKNAQEAITSAGVITLITLTHPKQLIIRDNGMGLLPESEELLFTPFFSTKKDGQGIGLTVIREILLNHGFNFSLKTTAPGRTEFRINFD